MSKRANNRRGFTLVELLVVVAIIGILAGISMPVISRSRARADRVACLSNIRQIGLAFASYLDDWDDTYPAAWNEWNTARYAASGNYDVGAPSIIECLAPYGATPELWRCPADTGLNLHFGDYWMTGSSRPLWMDGGTSYFYRDMFSREVADFPYPDPRNCALAARKSSVVARPTRVVLLMDVLPWHSPPQRTQSYWTWDGLTVALFCDGHAASRPWSTVRGNIEEAPGAQ